MEIYKKQPTVALSTYKAEYIGQANTTQESMYLTQLLMTVVFTLAHNVW